MRCVVDPPCLLPGTKCGHFSEDMFDDELMTGFVSSVSVPATLLTGCQPYHQQDPFAVLMVLAMRWFFLSPKTQAWIILLK